MWINGNTPCDLGGIHPQTQCSFLLDSLGLVPNTTYTMYIFNAERHTVGSSAPWLPRAPKRR